MTIGHHYDFAGPEWIEHAQRWIEHALAHVDLTDLDVEFCEEFTDPPSHLSPDGAPVAWHLIISGGAVVVAGGVIEARTKLVADYDTMLPIARAKIDPGDALQIAEITKTLGDAIADGTFTPPAEGITPTDIPALADLHNEMAKHTR